MNMKLRSLGWWIDGGLVGGLVLALLFLSQSLRMVDSEIWSFYLAHNWNPFEGSLTGFFWKPLQVLLLRSLSIFSPVEVSMDSFLATGRQFWSLLFSIQLLLIIRIANRLHVSKTMMIFGAGILFLSRYYLVESLRVRADSLAMIFLLVIVLEMIRSFQKIEDQESSSTSVFLFATFFGVLSTLKFLPQFLFVLILGAYFFKNQRRSILRSSLLNVSSIAIFFGVVALFPEGRQIVTNVFRSLGAAGSSIEKYQENLPFVFDQLVYLFPFWILEGFLLFRSMKNQSTDGRINGFLASFALTHSLVVLLHPEPFPWYAATTLPIHVLCVLRAIHCFGLYPTFQKFGWKVPAIGFLLMLLGFLNAFRNFPGMKDQTQAIQDLSRLSHLMEVKTYYDNCGLISDKRHTLPFITASQDFDLMVAEQMFRDSPPDLIIISGRTTLLLPKISDILEREYEIDSQLHGIMIRKSLLQSLQASGKFGKKSPKEVFNDFDWGGDWKFGSLFSPYLGYRFLTGIR